MPRPTGKASVLCFETWHNGRRVCLAGAPGYGVLTAIVCWVKRDPAKRRKGTPRRGAGVQELYLSVGGLYADEHLDWVESRRVRVGDVIEIRVARRRSADEPRHRRPSVAGSCRARASARGRRR